MFINHENSTIVITKSESKAAGIIGSIKYDELAAQMERFPSYKLVVEKEKKNKDYIDRINLEFMEAYIIAKKDTKNLEAFYTKKGCDSDGKKVIGLVADDFFSIRNWFLETYTEINDYVNQINEMKAQRKTKREATKMSKRVEEMERLIEVKAVLDNKAA